MRAEGELRDLRRSNNEMSEDIKQKNDKIATQESSIQYLNKKLNEEQQMQNTFSRTNFAPKGASIPRSNPTLPPNPSFPAPYTNKFQNGNSINKYQFTPLHNTASPFSKYSSDHKPMNSTPSANSIHSINLTGMSGQSSLKSSFQVNTFNDNLHKASGLANYTASFQKEINFEETKIDQNKENTPPMAMINTTKPVQREAAGETGTARKEFSMTKTNDLNMFERQKQSDPDSD